MATDSSAMKAAAAAVGGKAARACDGCLRRRARWYCAADDAFLCQGCDTSVHSANPLARRHERQRLRPTSPPLQHTAPPPAKRDEVVPAWFGRKARTPRGGHVHGAKSAVAHQALSRRLVVVPEAAGGGDGNDDDSPDGRNGGEGEVEVEVEEEEEQLLYRVPIFDPALAEFCSPPPLEDSAAALAASCNEDGGAVEDPASRPDPAAAPAQLFFPDGGHCSFEPTDAELREFAADMEALLGRGLDDGNEEDSSFYMETLGLLDPAVDDDDNAGMVKVEFDGGTMACGGGGLELGPEASDEMLDIDFDYEETTPPDEKAASSDTASAQFQQTSLSLTLNYEAIIKSWGTSPWTGGGDRPHVKLDDAWPHDYTGMWVGHGVEELGTPRLGMIADDAGREARVSRYREKRRTRLFSKKIRYEVRKLNAEKRPRMKGRFVKRTTAGGGVAVAGLA